MGVFLHIYRVSKMCQNRIIRSFDRKYLKTLTWVVSRYIYWSSPSFGYFWLFMLPEAHMIRNEKKKNILKVSSPYLNFNLCRKAMQVSHPNNMEFLTLNIQFFLIIQL